MGLIARIILMLINHQAKLRFLAKAKKTGTLAYLKALQGSRRVLILLLGAFMFVQVMLMAGFGALITGFMLWDYEYKLQVLFAIFLALFMVPFALLAFMFSEAVWYKYSGAKKLVEDIRQDDAA